MNRLISMSNSSGAKSPTKRYGWTLLIVLFAGILCAGTIVGANATTGLSPSTYTPVNPLRLLDTRSTGKVGALDGTGDARMLQVTGTIQTSIGNAAVVPLGSTAAAFNVTVVDGEAGNSGGYVTVYPCGTRPDASNLNFVQSQTVPNAVTSPISDAGFVCFYVYGKAHLLVDLVGYYQRAEDVFGSGGSSAVGPQGPPGATGPQGPQGATGQTGAQGPAGSQGPQGLQGVRGEIGADGVAGPQGLLGAQGPTGARGPVGADGIIGPQGIQGSQGLIGLQGPSGADGQQGPIGLTGADGAAGPQGLQGATGAQGPQGPQGTAGSNGVDGAQGPVGPQGATGYLGPNLLKPLVEPLVSRSQITAPNDWVTVVTPYDGWPMGWSTYASGTKMRAIALVTIGLYGTDVPVFSPMTICVRLVSSGSPIAGSDGCVNETSADFQVISNSVDSSYFMLYRTVKVRIRGPAVSVVSGDVSMDLYFAATPFSPLSRYGPSYGSARNDVMTLDRVYLQITPP